MKQFAYVENKLVTMAITKETYNGFSVKKDADEYYLADFLQTGEDKIYINIHLPAAYRGEGVWATEVGFYCERESHIDGVKELLNEIKLNPFDIDKMNSEVKTEFYFSDACPEFGMYAEFGNGRYVLIYINERLKAPLGANLTVQYVDYTQSKDEIHKYFTASIPEKTKRSLIKLADDMFDEFVNKL